LGLCALPCCGLGADKADERVCLCKVFPRMLLEAAKVISYRYDKEVDKVMGDFFSGQGLALNQ